MTREEVAVGRSVRIVGKHPHTGETGIVKAIKVSEVLQLTMAEIDLDDCPHGVDGCFAEFGNLRRIREDER